jgi:hypothetical protein
MSSLLRQSRAWPLAVLAALVSVGCSGDLRMAGGGWRPLFAPEGEPWTIQCLALTGVDRRKTAESVADVLRNTPRISRRDVQIEHGDKQSTVYYGTYYRRIDRQTQRLEVTEAMNRDMRLIKELGVPGQGHYFADAKFVPAPTPDMGNPAWSLERATGVYSLRVALFANEPGFYDRKKAAAEYAALLREKGFPAFYLHGPIHSEVFVGEFGEDAVTPVSARNPAGKPGVVGFDVLSPEVRALQAKENFAYELLNLRKRGEKIGDKTVYTASQLMRVRDALAKDQR